MLSGHSITQPALGYLAHNMDGRCGGFGQRRVGGTGLKVVDGKHQDLPVTCG